MHPFKLALAASTALIGTASLSFATVLHQTETFSSTTDWGTVPATANFSPTHTLSFAGFNPTAGTLTSISIEIIDKVNGSVDMTNKGSNTSSVTAGLSNTLRYNYPSLTTKTVNLNSSEIKQNLAPNASSGTQPVSGTTTVTKAVASANFAEFETGWTLTAGDLGQLIIGSKNGNGTATYSDTGSVTIKVSYNYTSPPPPPPPPLPPPPPTTVPEPASLSVLGAGLMGLGLLRRNRRKSN